MLPPEDVHEIGVDETAELLRLRQIEVRLIDCREEEEFAHCRIEGAELIPLSRFAEEVERRLGSPDVDGDDRPMVVYCHHGMRSMSATRYLRQKGHRRVWSLRGGIEAWSLEIDPSVARY
jgi:rhodanese-related sulfurtransferase